MFETSNDVSNDQIAALQQQLEFYQNELDVTRSQLQAAKSMTVEKMALLEAANKRTELLSKEKDSLTLENKKLFQRMELNLQNYFKRIAQYEGIKLGNGKNDKVNVQKVSIAVGTDNNNSRVDHLQDQLNELKKSNDELTIVLITTKKEKLELKAKYEEMNHFHREQIQNLQSEIEKMKDKIVAECAQQRLVLSAVENKNKECVVGVAAGSGGSGGGKFMNMMKEYSSLPSRKRSFDSIEESEKNHNENTTFPIPSSSLSAGISSNSSATTGSPKITKRKKAFAMSNQRPFQAVDPMLSSNNAKQKKEQQQQDDQQEDRDIHIQLEEALRQSQATRESLNQLRKLVN